MNWFPRFLLAMALMSAVASNTRAAEADLYCLSGTSTTGAQIFVPAGTLGASCGVNANLPPTTFLGTMALSAATSTSLTAANVTMAPNSAALPAAGAFGRLTIISPGSSCNFTVNWQGGTATATSGEQFGTGTNVGSDTVNLTGQTNAPTLFSTSGCSSPNVIQFHN